MKNFVGLHSKLIDQIDMCLSEGGVQAWIIRGIAVLTMMDLSKGNLACDYRPITFLPLVWKLSTGIIADEM